MNFMGLGFSLGAEDKGLAAAIKQTTSGLMDISKTVVGIGLASAKMMIKMPDIKPAIGMAQHLASDVKLTTTGLEAFGVAASKVNSATFAGLGLNSKQLSKMKSESASLAHSMNTDVGTVAKAFAELEQAGVDVRKNGFRSKSEYVKFLAVTGVSSQELTSSMAAMNKRLGMSSAAIKDVIQSVGAIGSKFKIGKEAYAGMNTTVSLLNANFEKLPENWSKEKLGAFIKGTTAVAGALASIGLPAEQATAASNRLGEVLLKGREGMDALYVGLADSLPAGMETLTKHLGEIAPSFDMLQNSPDQFMLKMGEMVKAVRDAPGMTEKSLTMFRLQMEKDFGPEVMAAFTKEGFSKLGPALKGATEPIKNQGEIVGDLAKAYQDGRTYADRFALAQDRIQTSLKKVEGVMSDATYLKTYTNQSKDYLHTVNEIAGKGGVLGKLTTSLIEVKNRGFGGFLASHSKFGFALSEGIQLMQPMMQYLPALGAAFSALASPIGIVAAAVAGLFFLFKDLGKGKDSVIAPMLNKLVDEAPKFIAKIWELASGVFDTVYAVLSKVDWGAVIATMRSAFTKIFGSIFSAIEKINWAKVGQVLGVALDFAFQIALDAVVSILNIGEKILKWLDGVNWGAIGNKLGGYFAQIGLVIYNVFEKVLSNLPSLIGKVFERGLALVIGILDGMRDWFITKFPEAAKPIFVLFEVLKGIAVIVVTRIKLGFQAVGVVLTAVWEVLKWVLSTVVDVAVAVGDAVQAIGRVAGDVVDFFSSSGDSLADLWKNNNKMADDAKVKSAEIAALNQKIEAGRAAAEVKRMDDLDRSLAASGQKSKNWILTVEGDVLKGSQAFVRLEKDATGKIIEVAHNSAKYLKAVVGGEAATTMNDIQNEIKRMNAITNSLKGDEKAHAKAQDAALAYADKAHRQYLETYGVQWDVAFRNQKKLSEQFALEIGVVENAKKAGEGYYAVMIANQTALSAASNDRLVALEKENQAGTVNFADYMKQMISIKSEQVDGIAQMKESAAIASGDLGALFKQYAGTLEGAALFAERAAFSLGKKFSANASAAMGSIKGLGEAQQAQAKELIAQAEKGLAVQAEMIAKDTKLTAEARALKIRALEEAYKKDFDMLDASLKAQALNLKSNVQTGSDTAIQIYKDKTALLTSAASALNKEGAASLAKNTGMSTEAAMANVKDIGAMNRGNFLKNIDVISKSYMKFLTEMEAKGKTLLTSTTNSFNKLWETMDAGWKANQKVMEEFGVVSAKFIDGFWKKITEKASTETEKVLGLVVGIGRSLATASKVINIMSLLASPSDIERWAASVVSALAIAMRGGAVADSLMGSLYTKALLAVEAAKATPDTVSMSNPGGSPLQSSARDQILAAMNSPLWAQDKQPIPGTLKEISETLVLLLAATKSGGSGTAPPRKKSEIDQNVR